MPTTASLVSTGDVLTATQFNYLPRGVVQYVTVATNQTGITTVADLTSYTLTWTATSSRLYRVSAYLSCRSLATSASPQIILTDSANNQKARQVIGPLGLNEYFTTPISTVVTGLSGSITWKLRGQTDSGTLSILGLDVGTGYMVVEDLGAA